MLGKLKASAAVFLPLFLFALPSNANGTDTIWLSCVSDTVPEVNAPKFSYTLMIDWKGKQIFAYEDQILYNLSSSPNDPNATRGAIFKKGYNMQFSPDVVS